MIIELVYIGRDFYFKSGTAMSSIYRRVGKQFVRFDWGFVQNELDECNEIHIKPAKIGELEFFESMFNKIKGGE